MSSTKPKTLCDIFHEENLQKQDSKFVKIAKEIGQLVTEKNKAYGNSFEESEKILKVLFPDGVKPEQYKNLLTITRVLDKIFRIATHGSNDPMKENPWQDIMGYALLAVASEDK